MRARARARVRTVITWSKYIVYVMRVDFDVKHVPRLRQIEFLAHPGLMMMDGGPSYLACTLAS